MKVTFLKCLVIMSVVAPMTWAQTTEDAPAPAAAPKPEDAQAKALRDQLERETAARKAERDAAIAADIARNPDGANAQAARKAEEEKKAAELEKQAADEKAKAASTTEADAAAAKAEKENKEAAARWAAQVAAERAKAEAANKAAVAKWRASAKPAPSILMGQRSDGTFTVMVDGNISTFATAAEAQAFAEKIRRERDTTLSY